MWSSGGNTGLAPITCMLRSVEIKISFSVIGIPLSLTPDRNVFQNACTMIFPHSSDYCIEVVAVAS